ncbi:MAG: 16S rRNA (uracil(1498)-N(3))-methyltransferase [Thermodesulfobacteria bacterium]|nr:16S rRNA (uracil(1498)-N(3))-methyltransferase [Thermodesulfobacteriota bacterium]
MQAGGRFFFEYQKDLAVLLPQDAHHAVKVLRKKVGDKILLIDGKGKEFEGEIIEINYKKRTPEVKARIISLLRTEKSIKPYLIALIPLLKKENTELIVEKGTELGVSCFIPFISQHTVAKKDERFVERLKKKSAEALKQSGRLILPEIKEIKKLEEFLRGSIDGKLVVGVPEGKIKGFEELLSLKKHEKVYLLTGPEGGFSKEEESLIDELNPIKVSLGRYILKAETASIVIMGIFSFICYNF